MGVSVVNVAETRTMYNLDVVGNDNFFVGEKGWLVHNTDLLPCLMGERLLNEAALKGPELVSGFRVFGNKGLAGDTYIRNILLFEAVKKGEVPIGKFFAAIEKEALQAGATKINIGGYAVINPKIVNPSIAKRFGYTFEQQGDNVFLTKILKP